MPTYAWSCHACGASNPAEASACKACRCPAIAGLPQIESSRQWFARVGDDHFQGDEGLGDYRTPFQDKKEVTDGLRNGAAMLVMALIALPAYSWLPRWVVLLDPRLVLLGPLIVVGAVFWAVCAGYRSICAVFSGNKLRRVADSMRSAPLPDDTA